MKALVANNVAAEMMAIANALHEGVRLGLVRAFDEVLLQTDCMPAIDAFTGVRRKLIDQEHAAVSHLQSLQERFTLALEFRHVKGHSGRSEARFVTNKLCDRRAKEAMRKARGQLQLNKLKELVK